MKSTALASRNNVRVVPATEAFMCDKTSRMKHTKKNQRGKNFIGKVDLWRHARHFFPPLAEDEAFFSAT